MACGEEKGRGGRANHQQGLWTGMAAHEARLGNPLGPVPARPNAAATTAALIIEEAVGWLWFGTVSAERHTPSACQRSLGG